MVIDYFSATGNSYAAAKEIASRLKADLKSIPSVVNEEKIQINASSMGIVFPSYMAPVSGCPLIIERFIRKIENINSIHIFAICTCGGYECVNALPSLKKLRHMIQSCGGRLAEEYSIRLPMNNLDYDHIPVPIIRDTEVIIRKSKTKIDAICNRILHNKGTRFKIVKNLMNGMMSPFYKMMQPAVLKDLRERAKEPEDSKLQYFDLMPLTDKSITVNNQCTGCGICARVCPASNIKFVNGRPEFQHQCEMCFACDEWCPTNAIQHWSRAAGIKYHHPEVKLSDMLKAKQQDGR